MRASSRSATVDKTDPLHHVQQLRVRRVVIIDERLRRDPDRVHDQFVAVVMANGFAVPGGFERAAVALRAMSQKLGLSFAREKSGRSFHHDPMFRPINCSSLAPSLADRSANVEFIERRMRGRMFYR